MKHFHYLLMTACFSAALIHSAQAEEAVGNSNLTSKPAGAAPAASQKSFFDLFKDGGSAKQPNATNDNNANTLPQASTAADANAASPAQAEAETPVSLTNEQRELMRVQYYLNSISTIVADFTQIGPDGNLTMGKFYLKRPGKIRWEYAPPTPILIIANGRNLVYYDKELEQVSHLPIDSTLAGFMAREKIDLSDPKLKVDSLTTAPGVLRIRLSQKGKPDEGSLMLEFADQPLQIRNMVITDQTKQVTTVSLSKAKFGVPLENQLFIWKDPRSKR